MRQKDPFHLLENNAYHHNQRRFSEKPSVCQKIAKQMALVFPIQAKFESLTIKCNHVGQIDWELDLSGMSQTTAIGHS